MQGHPSAPLLTIVVPSAIVGRGDVAATPAEPEGLLRPGGAVGLGEQPAALVLERRGDRAQLAHDRLVAEIAGLTAEVCSNLLHEDRAVGIPDRERLRGIRGDVVDIDDAVAVRVAGRVAGDVDALPGRVVPERLDVDLLAAR